MSDASQGPGWWLASDGRWYPPEQAPALPGAPVPSGATGWYPYQPEPASVSPGLATALRITFWVVAAVSGVRLLAAAATWVSYAGFRSDGGRSAYDTWRNISVVTGLWGVVTFAASMTLLVLVIVWSWQAHRAVTDLGAHQRWRIGWTIGGWFTCCAAVVIPKLVLLGVERGALAPRRDGRVRATWDGRPTLPIGWLWWLALVGSTFRFTFSTTGSGDSLRDAMDQGSGYTGTYTVEVIAAALAVVAALAGAAYFGRMSERLTPEGLAAHRDD